MTEKKIEDMTIEELMSMPAHFGISGGGFVAMERAVSELGRRAKLYEQSQQLAVKELNHFLAVLIAHLDKSGALTITTESLIKYVEDYIKYHTEALKKGEG